MSERLATYITTLAPNDKVRVPSHPELGVGEVLRVAESAGFYQADVVFDTPAGRRLEVFPVELLEKTGDLWQRLQQGSFDDPALYRVKQVALDLVHANDALLEEARSAAVTGDVAELGIGSLCARYLVRRRDERGMIQSRILTLSYDAQTKEVRSLSHFLTSEGQPTDAAAFDLSEARAAIESSLEAEINAWIPSRQGRIGLNISLVGLHY